jgi:2-methylcitrate dehydratase PrpD
MKVSLQKELAIFVVQNAANWIREEHYQRAIDHILDTIGVGVAGQTDPIAQALFHYSENTAQKGSNTILGSKADTSVENAAFVNGILCHALDYDDSSWRLIGHPSTVVLPAVLAVAEQMDVTGQELLTAYIIGTEVSCKLGVSVEPDLYQAGWHATSTVGVLGAAAGAGYLLGLNLEQMVNAFGIAASSACGLRRNFGTMTKPYHAGIAARNGVSAAYLAKYGLSSSPHALDHEMGYVENFTRGRTVAGQQLHLGEPFDLMEPGFFLKPYPSCAATHTAIDAMLSLVKEYQFQSQDVDSIYAGSGPVGPVMLFYRRPETGAQGKFCMPFVLAAAVVNGQVGLDTFSEEFVKNQQILHLMDKVEFKVDDSFLTRSVDEAPAKIQVKLKDGRVLEKVVEQATGSPAFPLSKEALLRKYRDCTGRVFDSVHVEKSLQLILSLQHLPGISMLMKELKP